MSYAQYTAVSESMALGAAAPLQALTALPRTHEASPAHSDAAAATAPSEEGLALEGESEAVWVFPYGMGGERVGGLWLSKDPRGELRWRGAAVQVEQTSGGALVGFGNSSTAFGPSVILWLAAEISGFIE